MKHYIYVFCDPRKPGKYEYGLYVFNFEPFYVGSGKDNRYKRHLDKSQLNLNYNTIKNGKLKHIIESGYNPLEYVVILINGLTEDIARSKEMEVVKEIGRINLGTGPLANLTDGGEGMSNHISGLKNRTYEDIFGDELAKKLKQEKSERFKGKNNPMYGKKSWCFGKKLKQSTRQKISDARSMKVKQMDKSNNIIKIWDKSKDAAKFLGVSVSGIHNVLNDKMPAKTCGGFRWEYIDRNNVKYI
jgi:hypothetical protein